MYNAYNNELVRKFLDKIIYLYTNNDTGQTIAKEPTSQQLFTDMTHLKSNIIKICFWRQWQVIISLSSLKYFQKLSKQLLCFTTYKALAG